MEAAAAHQRRRRHVQQRAGGGAAGGGGGPLPEAAVAVRRLAALFAEAREAAAELHLDRRTCWMWLSRSKAAAAAGGDVRGHRRCVGVLHHPEERRRAAEAREDGDVARVALRDRRGEVAPVDGREEAQLGERAEAAEDFGRDGRLRALEEGEGLAAGGRSSWRRRAG